MTLPSSKAGQFVCWPLLKLDFPKPQSPLLPLNPLCKQVAPASCSVAPQELGVRELEQDIAAIAIAVSKTLFFVSNAKVCVF